jgi:nitrite reductase (cytochrome c-552)
VGTSVEDIEQHYDEYGFEDWEHRITGAPMIKIQHPEFEMFTSSTHFAAGVACADCHMPYVREGGVKVSDHWVRSPLDNLNNACQSCHTASEQELETRILTTQGRTKDLMESVEDGLADAIEAIAAAAEAGVPDEALTEARELHRAAQLRWDFVDAENSMGFHSPQEAVRVLGHAADLARQAELSATKALAAHGG